MLPLGPTGYGNSPYMCFSAFGGNGLLSSPETLVQEDLLSVAEVRQRPDWPRHRVDDSAVIRYKMPLLEVSFQRFKDRFAPRYPDDFYAFCERHAFWFEDYALFTALKAWHGGRSWTEWEEGAARRDSEAWLRWRHLLTDATQFCPYVQYQFFK